MADTNIKNLSVGWVGEIVKDKYYFTPGFTPVRKIIYSTSEGFGVDILNQSKNNLPITYPIVDFKDDNKGSLFENGEYVIMPFTTIGTYLSAFGIIDGEYLNYFKKLKIKNLIFDNYIVVKNPLFLGKNINLEKYKQEKDKLSDYKIYYLSTTVSESETKYLESISSYQKTL